MARLSETDTVGFTRRGHVVATDNPPNIDGNLEDPVWRRIPSQKFRNLRAFEEWVTLRKRYDTPPFQGGLSTVRMAWDQESLYLAFRCHKLYGERQPWSGGDGVKIFLQPQLEGTTHRIAVASNGEVDTPENAAEHVQAASKDDSWYFDLEVAIPFEALGMGSPENGDTWKANFCRTEKPLDEPTAWSFTSNYKDSSAFGVCEFVETTPQLATIKGEITNQSSLEDILIESANGIFFPGESGFFEIDGLTQGKTTIRLGSFQHYEKSLEYDIDREHVTLPSIDLKRLPQEEIRRKKAEAAEKIFHYTPQFHDDPVHRDYQGCPSLCVLPDGGLLVTYTCYGGENNYNAIVVDASYDRGETWQQEFVMKPGFYRASWGNLWVDPLQRVWMFHQLWLPGEVNLQYTRSDNFKSGAQNWLEPEVLCDEVSRPESLVNQMDDRNIRYQGLFPKFINKPIVLSDDTWLAPVESNEFSTKQVLIVVSTDNGSTWNIRGEAPIAQEHRQISEPMVVERQDGSLWMLIRTEYGLAESVSHDKGRTWAEFKRSSIPHCDSRFFLGRLKSGRLLLVKHGSMSEIPNQEGQFTGREQMTALLSDDDGSTWPYSLLLYDGTCSYPDVDQDDDGRIYVVYDQGREGYGAEILISTFREEDIVEGEVVSDDAILNRTVAKTGPAEPDILSASKLG